jgi:hypothetical protein
MNYKYKGHKIGTLLERYLRNGYELLQKSQHEVSWETFVESALDKFEASSMIRLIDQGENQSTVDLVWFERMEIKVAGGAPVWMIYNDHAIFPNLWRTFLPKVSSGKLRWPSSPRILLSEAALVRKSGRGHALKLILQN